MLLPTQVVPFIVMLTGLLLYWCLWARRQTWTCMWERSITISILCMAFAATLIYEPVGAPLGHAVQHLTGMYNLRFLLAHISFVAAICSAVHSSVHKLTPDKEFAIWFKKRIEVPAFWGIVAMFTLFALGKVANDPHPDFTTMPMIDNYLSAYFITYSGLILYLMYHWVRALIDLWYDEPSRHFVSVYLVGAGFLALGLVLKIFIALFWTSRCPLCGLAVIASLIGVVIITLGAAQAWTERVRWFTDRDTAGDAETSEV